MKNRIALVTGAGRGIGRAIALGLAAEGARVAVSARTFSELESVAAAITEAGGQALPLTADLSQRSAVAPLVEAIEKQWGAVEILVNNAGVGSSQDPKPLVEFDDDFWDLTMQVNVTAPYLLSKRMLPAMIQAGWGRIINIASINAKVASLHGAAYTASKHALGGLTRAAAKDVEGTGVTVNAVCPGVTATKMNDLRIEYDAQRLGQTTDDIERRASPLGRRLEPDEVAALAVFLAGDSAAAIHGQLINVCGGLVTS